MSTENSSIESEVGITASAKNPAATAAGLKANKQRWSGFFTNTKGTKMELLVEMTNNYNRHGVPRLPDSLVKYEIDENEDCK